jgi:hypothetical protein
MRGTKEVSLKIYQECFVQYIRRDKILVAAVPQIEGLTVEDMLDLAKKSPNALRHIPDERDWDGLNRKWLSDILFTVERAKFEKAIKDAVKARKERLEEKNNLLVDMRPEFAAAFNNCMSFSRKYFLFSQLFYSGKWPCINADEVLLEEKAHQGRIGRGEVGGRCHEVRYIELPPGSEAPQARARRDACNDLRGSDPGADAG